MLPKSDQGVLRLVTSMKICPSMNLGTPVLRRILGKANETLTTETLIENAPAHIAVVRNFSACYTYGTKV